MLQRIKIMYTAVIICTIMMSISCKADDKKEVVNEKKIEVKSAAAPIAKPVTKKNAKLDVPPAKETVAETNEYNAGGNSSQQKLLRLVNNARAKGCRCGGKYYKPTGALTWNNKLESAAKKHSNYMKRRGVMSHTGKGGSDAGRRMSAEGYSWRTYGENVAMGYPNEEAVVKGWLKSKGHCKNIMNPDFKEMGVASSGTYWTQVFGTKR